MKRKRLWYSLAPLLILLVVIGLINLQPATNAPAQLVHVTSTTNSAEQPPLAVTVSRPPILLATVLPSPTPSPTPRPALPTGAAITLSGPPPESALPANGPVAFYWTYSETVAPGQQFVLILQQNEKTFRIEAGTQANLGDSYRYIFDPSQPEFTAGTTEWQISLEWSEDQQQLLASEQRTLVLAQE